MMLCSRRLWIAAVDLPILVSEGSVHGSVPASSSCAALWRDLNAAGLTRARRIALGLSALAIAATIWLPCMHLLFVPRLDDVLREEGIPPGARALAARHLRPWSGTGVDRRGAPELARMRVSNAEWDFMGRTFLVLSLANMALRDSAGQRRYLETMDQIIDDTLALERERGIFHFLMDYARRRPFVQQPPRSIFVDGEIALMLGARRLVQERTSYGTRHRQRVALMVNRMQAGPVTCAESYPDECWIFCNAAALAAIKIADALDGTDHAAFFTAWLRSARRALFDRSTGLLNSSFTLDGRVKDGPEGSSIWFAAHCLQLIDPVLAREQYERSRRELGRTILGFGYAREWPRGWPGPPDIDSGPIVPGLEASPGSSGLALVGAAAFGDHGYYTRLAASLSFAAFPVERDGWLRYAASNQVGDAVVLYSMVLGPLWAKVAQRSRR
jgi:hypothetical protein